MKITPLFDRLIVLPVRDGATTKGGLLVPDVARNKSPFAYGEVLAIGPGRVNGDGATVACVVKVGDVVQYNRAAGQAMPYTDESGAEIEVVGMREPEVWGVVTGLARDTGLLGVDGKLLAMAPESLAKPDRLYEGREQLIIAKREGWDVSQADIDAE